MVEGPGLHYETGMSIQRFTRKHLVIGSPEETVTAIAERMYNNHVGAVVIVDQGRLVGMVTDRDLTLRVLAKGRPGTTPVREVMSGDLVTAHVDDSLDEIAFRMRKFGVRRLPILARDGSLSGLVALDDLVVLLAGELATTAQAVVANRGP